MKRGFTLIEAMVTVALTTIVMLTLAGLIHYFYQADASMLGQWQGIANQRTAIERAMTGLREGIAVTDAESSSLTYEALLGGATTSATIALDGATFAYYDASGTPLTDPVDPRQVRSILVRETVGTMTILSGAALRNASTTP